jgi:hypothetical protein
VTAADASIVLNINLTLPMKMPSCSLLKGMNMGTGGCTATHVRAAWVLDLGLYFLSTFCLLSHTYLPAGVMPRVYVGAQVPGGV